MLECTDRQRQHKGPLTTMSFPWYARSIVKYKSPHPQDLSFPKDQDLRVLGYADRGAEEEEAEEEDDRWYVGEWLDGSRQGQFPASLVVRINSEEVDVPHSPAMPAAEPISPPKDISSENASSVAPEHVQEKAPMNAEEPQEKVLVEGVQELVHGEASGSAEQPQEKVQVKEVTVEPEVARTVPIEQPMVQEVHAEKMPQDSERVEPEPCNEVMAPLQEQAPAPITPTLSESVPETQASATLPFHSPKDTPAEPTQDHAAPSSTTDAQVAEPSIDPSAMSLRDRIAAFNKPVEKGPPPPLPRGKPGSWKRTVPANVAPKHVDARTDAAPSTMSASDAQSSIKMSLKERMSALQRNEEAIARPALTKERQTPSKLTNSLPAEPSGEDAEHRASIARRMAALGGRRVEPGLFGILPKAEAPKQKDQEDSSEQDASEKAKSQDSQAMVASTGEAPLVVPRRPVAPRTRRIKPAQEPAKGSENSEVHHSTERQIPAFESATDPPAPPMDEGASTVESSASCKAGEECREGGLVTHKEPGEAPAAHNEQFSTLEGEVGSEKSVPARETTESCVPAQQEALALPPSDPLSTKPVQPSSEALPAPYKADQGVLNASLTGSVDTPEVEPTEPQALKTLVPPIQEREDTPLPSEHDVYSGMQTVSPEQPAIPSPTDPIEHIAYAMSTMSASNGVTEDSDPDFAEQHALLEHLLQHPGEASCIRQEPVSSFHERTPMASPPIMGMPMPPRRSTHDNISPLSPMEYDKPFSYTKSPVGTETAPSTRMPPRPTRRAPTLPVSEDTLPSPPIKPRLSSSIIDVPIPNSDAQAEEATSPSSAVPDRPRRAPPRAPSSETPT